MDELEQLYQRLRRLGALRLQAHWLVRRASGGEWCGPYVAAEVAYLIWSGRLGGPDLVAHRQERRIHVIGDTPCLSRWLGGDSRLVVPLRRSLERAVQFRSRSYRSSSTTPRRDWTPEQRRALRLLGLAPTSSAADLARAQRLLALRYHPDRGGSLEQMQQINRACQLLQSRLPALSGPL